MNLKIKFCSFPFVITIVFLACSIWSKAKAKSSNEDGIVMTAEAIRGENGRTHIVCSITNKSAHILASAYPRTRSESYCFQFHLKDIAGKYLAMNGAWAWDNGQVNESPSADGSIGHMSTQPIYMRPSEKTEFTFDLEDAYGERSGKGRVLEVTWRNYYPDSQIAVGEKRLDGGKMLPAYEEINHFPGRRVFSVSLPLPTAEPETEGSAAGEKPVGVETQLPEVPAVNPRQKPAKSTAESAPNHWWWLLLAIPLIFLIWRSVRWKRQA